VNLDSFLAEWSELHGGAKISGVVRGWLRVSYILVRPLIRLRITPDAVTYLGLLLGLLTWWQGLHPIAMALLALSLIADGIDGSLAIASERLSRWGAELDSVVDRLVEFFWALTFIKIGAPIIIVGVAWIAALVQEYARARAAGVGYRSIGVVTISERPVRAIFLFVALVTHFLGLHLLSIIASMWCIVQLLALMMVLRDSYAALRSDD
jgi:archaetidylinositol phosphate synthase